ncbi:ATP-binding protein [Candidatus Saccharibacteria bacterium]|nr:ATP-binding protein [Candidatus Saccharibacteria bacterium]
MERMSYLRLLDNLRDTQVIKVVTGVRRSGKSTLLEQFRERLIKGGVPESRVQFYNLEDKLNKRYTLDADLLHDDILSVLVPGVMNYIFIDEVQLIPEFEKTLDSLHLRQNVDLYVTGSNADITSSEIGTLLSGRYVEIKMQPLTFSEFLQFFPDGEVDKFAKFQTFMRFGGFPEVAKLLAAGRDIAVAPYLRGIYETVLEKDIKTRKNIRFMDDFRNLISFTFNNIGSVTSPNNISNVLRSENQVIDKSTVSNYLDALSDCYIMYPVQRFDVRGKQLLKTLEKYYAVDLGLVDAVLGMPSGADVGHRLENIVFLELFKRYDGKVWVGKNYEKEIDFVCKDLDGTLDYYQVAETAANPETLMRELSSIENTGDKYRKTLLTLDLIETDESGVARRNIVNWLCDVDK